jgi:polysaccharide biosynthesis protein PslJ
MSTYSARSAPRPPLHAAVVVASVLILAVSVATGTASGASAALVFLVTSAVLVRRTFVPWPGLIAGLIIVILFVPIRRYTLPAGLPFQLEPYRVYVALLVTAWALTLLVDPRTKLRRTGMEGPVVLVVGALLVSIAANPRRVASFSTEVNKALMFFLSFLLVLYLMTSVVRGMDVVDRIVKVVVSGGAIVALFAIVEARTGFNVFNHLSEVVPYLQGGDIAGPEFKRFGTAQLRVFGSAEHPIALSAALVMLTPLALYLAARHRQRRWLLTAVVLGIGCLSTVSRTGVLMLVVVAIVFLWLRPKETIRLWPAAVVGLVVVHLLLPGTLGALKQSFSPARLVAEQRASANTSGSGRLADLGPALEQWAQRPLAGQGFGTTVVDLDAPGAETNILDNQWLGTLLATGALGVAGWLWFFVRAVRRFGAEARRDLSDRGQLLAAITAAISAYAVGMLTYDAFAFVQVTFVLFILVGLGCALTAASRDAAATR